MACTVVSISGTGRQLLLAANPSVVGAVLECFVRRVKSGKSPTGLRLRSKVHADVSGAMPHDTS